MNIHENPALLDAFADGELTPEELSSVQAHLATCPECRAYVDDALAIRAACPGWEDTPLPAGFTQRVMEAVAHTPQSRPKKQPWGRLAAAAACLAVIVLAQHGPWRTGSTDSTTAAYNAYAAADTPSASMDAAAEDTEISDSAGIQRVTDGAGPDGLSPDTEAEKQLPAADANGTPLPTEDGTELADDALQGSLTAFPPESDSWIEGDNVVFSSTVFLAESQIGDALAAYTGKPYSNAATPEKGVLGTGYALEQGDYERILKAAGCPLWPAANPERTTELCCIVVTTEPAEDR